MAGDETVESLSALRVVDLRDRLRKRGLKTGGGKSELVSRLWEDMNKEEAEPEAPAKTTEVKKTTTTTKTKTEKKAATAKPAPSKEKKTVPPADSKPADTKESQLKRAARLGLPVKSDSNGTTSAEVLGSGSTAAVEAIPESKKKKVRAERFQTAEYRLQQRKERFGEEAFMTEAEKIAKRRRERFGLPDEPTKKRPLPEKSLSEQEEKKRRRLERFGPTSGNVLDPLVVQRRAERFNIVAAPKQTTSSPSSRKSSTSKVSRNFSSLAGFN